LKLADAAHELYARSPCSASTSRTAPESRQDAEKTGNLRSKTMPKGRVPTGGSPTA
jgi:hypothetical protein